MLGLLLDTEEYRNGFASGLGRQIPIFSLVKKPAHSWCGALLHLCYSTTTMADWDVERVYYREEPEIKTHESIWKTSKLSKSLFLFFR